MIFADGIEDYAREHSLEEDGLFRRLADVTLEKTSDPGMQTGHMEATLLRMLVQLGGAKRVLEIGTFTGYSALAMAMGLPEDGELITLDKDPNATRIAQRCWKHSPHGGKIKLMLGDAMDSLKSIKGFFDFVFIDADKENYIAYWDHCVPRVRKGGMIVVDNTLWHGAVLDPKEPLDYTIDEFNEHACGDERVELLLLTVRDGLTLARRIG
jgi:caffeoyl-CoA O-methyltransferase